METILQHKGLTLVAVILIIAAAWWGFTQSATSAPVLSTTSAAGSATDAQDQTIVSTLLQLQAVSLNGSILTDPGFSSLQDFTTQIVSEPVGRADPFAPTSGSVKSASSTTVNPNLFAPKK